MDTIGFFVYLIDSELSVSGDSKITAVVDEFVNFFECVEKQKDSCKTSSRSPAIVSFGISNSFSWKNCCKSNLRVADPLYLSADSITGCIYFRSNLKNIQEGALSRLPCDANRFSVISWVQETFNQIRNYQSWKHLHNSYADGNGTNTDKLSKQGKWTNGKGIYACSLSVERVFRPVSLMLS